MKKVFWCKNCLNMSTRPRITFDERGWCNACVWMEEKKSFDWGKREEELIEFAKERIARFKAPKYVEFGELPKTSTGKIQKYILRDREWAGKDKRIQGSNI